MTDYPATSWTLTYYFRNASAYFDVTASADGASYSVEVAKATTASKTVGKYDWIAVVSDATYRYEVDRGRVEILPNLATGAAYDARTFARKMLEAIEASLLSQATASQLDLVQAAMADRSLQYNKTSLIKLRNLFKAEVLREENAERIRQGEMPRNRVLVRF